MTEGEEVGDAPRRRNARRQRQGRRNRGQGLQELVAVSAFIVSLASIFIAYQENRASKQMVQASSMPYLTLSATFNRRPDLATTAVVRTLQNDGIGPADVRSARMTYRGRPYDSIGALLRDCCGIAHAQTTASLTNRMIRSGAAVDFLVLKGAGEERGIDRYAQLTRAGQIGMEICYCSVFDECWTLDNRRDRPVPTQSCPISHAHDDGL